MADREDEIKDYQQKFEEFAQVVEGKDSEIDQLNEELDALTEDLKKASFMDIRKFSVELMVSYSWAAGSIA